MMQVFQIKGFSGLMMFILAVISVMILLILLPATFTMVFWNAVVFEGLAGPQIGLFQGMLLWIAIVLLLKLIINPQISFQFKHVSDPADIDKHLNDLKGDYKGKDEFKS